MATLSAVLPLGLQPCTKQVIPSPLWNRPADFANGFSGGFTLKKSQTRPNPQVQASTNTDQQILRKQANFAPTVWGDHFINSVTSSTLSEYESYTREVNVLKEQVKDMLMASTSNPVQNIHLIDLLSRQGLAYHYEAEIELQLHQLFYGEYNIFRDNGYDLDTMARLFRLCRQYGYNIACVVFNKFLDADGNLKANLESDTKAMLNLYEACHVSLPGEDFLDKALSLTTTHLKALVKEASLSQHLALHIKNALEQPFHKGVPRFEARKYIAFYAEEEEEECRHDKILKFAKLDFNRLQLLYQQELSYLSSWWKEINLASGTLNIRDRMVETYALAVGTIFQPCYGRARITFTKTLMFLSVMDDAYDSYGTPEELIGFAEAIRRWDIFAVDLLPDYLKNFYRTLLNLYEELDNEMTAEGRLIASLASKNLTFKFQKLSDALHKETQWFDKGYVPSLNEYMMLGRITGAARLITAASFVGMENAKADAFEWLQSNHRLIVALNIIIRLTNDIVSHKREQATGQSASSVECYMKQYSLSEEEVIDNFEKIFETEWKIINQEFMKPTPISNHLMLVGINLARSCGTWYKFGNGYTEPEYVKDYMSLMLLEKIPI